MSSLRVETLTLPAARLGAENPLPPLAASSDTHADIVADPGIPAEDRRYIGWGVEPTPLPYRMQDDYDRRLEPRGFTAVVLENEHLRATFLPELGGRLWSLRSLDDDRELLFANRAFQPANLALRNAWFAGGVEWNIGLVGHCPFTCSRIFAARAAGPGGTPMLRMWEWERIRRVPFQIDAFLPPGSRALLVHVSIVNPGEAAVPMYWWSNTAVPETPGMRVIAPADFAYTFAYGGVIRRVEVPLSEGADITRPDTAGRAVDYFFRIPDEARRWEVALGRDGRGLAQTSTPTLRGRKLFLWGMIPGGRRWQEYLCGPGAQYLEIQAGLARTQAEHFPIPAGARVSWLEAYGPAQADPARVHGTDWRAAREAAASAVEQMMPRKDLDRLCSQVEGLSDAPPIETICRGSGWGALERRRRGSAVSVPLPGAPFDDDTLGPEQHPWLELLEHGELPEDASGGPPTSVMAQAEWKAMLERSVNAGKSRNWSAWNHLGVLRSHAGDGAGAAEAFRESLACRRTPWALRNLAVLTTAAGNAGGACDLLLEARAARPDSVPLTLETGTALIAAGRHAEWLAMLDRLPEGMRGRGRVRLLEGRAALALGHLDRVQAILDDMPEIPDMREGEVSLTDLWFGLHERRLAARLGVAVDEPLRKRVRLEFPPPAAIDFRVAPDGGSA